MPSFHIGASTDRAPRPRYLEKLSFVEYDFRTAAPAAKTFTRWREESGPALVTSLVAPASLWGDRNWPLREQRATDAEVERLTAMTRALKPRVLVLRSPATIRPGSTALARTMTLFERVRPLAEICVWEPQGVWTHEEALAAVRGKNIVVAADPLHDPVQNEKIVYARMRGLGHDRRYHEGRLEDLATAVMLCDEVFVVFATENAFAEARKFRVVAEQIKDTIEEMARNPDSEDEDSEDSDDGEDSDEFEDSEDDEGNDDDDDDIDDEETDDEETDDTDEKHKD